MIAGMIVPIPFPLDFDIEDGPCLVCGADLDVGWVCTSCGTDHFEGVMLLIGYGTPAKSVRTTDTCLSGGT